jgi:hypothetical protein
MHWQTTLQILRLAIFLELLPGAAEAKGNVVFWISPEGLAALPEGNTWAGEITTAPAVFPPVRMTGKDGAENEQLEKNVKLGIDLYYANDFEKSESILNEVWKDLQVQREARSVPAHLLAECFAFRMLNLKVRGKTEQALSLALEAGPLVRKDLLDDMDIPPDGLGFIEDALDKAGPQMYGLAVDLPHAEGPCTIFVDGVASTPANGTIFLSDALHWIGTECGDDAGWEWRIEKPAFSGKELRLRPDDESACDPSAFPVIACSRLTRGVIDIASNFLAYPDFDAVSVMKPSVHDGHRGVALADLYDNATPEGLQWKWKPLPEKQAAPHNATRDEAPTKTRLNKAALAMGLAGVAAAGVSTGLGIWSLHLRGSSHAIQDPWERQESEQEYKGAAGAAIALSVLAAGLIITSIAYYAIYHKKHKIRKIGLETPEILLFKFKIY